MLKPANLAMRPERQTNSRMQIEVPNSFSRGEAGDTVLADS